MDTQRVLVTGAGGFIGHHLVSYLKGKGYWVRGVDLKPPAFAATEADEFWLLDLRRPRAAQRAMSGIQEVYALAADMGGMGFISRYQSRILRHNSLIDLHTLEAARRAKVQRFFYASSACVYPEQRQSQADAPPLREEEAYPAHPQDSYGWQKLITERLCLHYHDEYQLSVRIARFHNIYGPLGTWEGGREKAPAAICRKVALARLTGRPEIEIWGDGEQTRSFCYIDDCIEGIYRLMQADYSQPLNLGRDESVTINELVDIIAGVAGIQPIKKYIPGPQGVRGRNSDNTRLYATLNWSPVIPLSQGLIPTYTWIESQLRLRLAPS